MVRQCSCAQGILPLGCSSSPRTKPGVGAKVGGDQRVPVHWCSLPAWSEWQWAASARGELRLQASKYLSYHFPLFSWE